MVIQFFSGIAKKENSTARPSAVANRLSLTGILKEPCSVLAPVVKIERLSNDVNPCIYTYAVIDNFRRYYFVEDWVWADGLWEVHMKEDVLATWRDVIGAQTEYILRTDSTTDYNGEITDITYPATSDVTVEESNLPNIFTDYINSGCYVVGIISGNDTQAVGAISYYMMTSAQFGDLKEALLSDSNLVQMGLAIIDPSTGNLTPTISDISLQVLKTMYNPFQYIVSCMWFPFPITLIPSDKRTLVSSIKIGWWDYSLQGYRIYIQTISVSESPIPFSQHPQASTRGSYLNYPPFTKRTIIGRFGTVAVDSFNYHAGDQIVIRYVIDLITGQCRAEIQRETSNLVYELMTERMFLLGVPIQLAQVGMDYLGTAVNLLDTAPKLLGGAFEGFISGGVGGAIGGAISGGLSGVYNTLQSAMPQLETSGANGSFLSAGHNTSYVNQFFKIVDEDIHHRGRPLCELRQIDTLSGFILCAEGDIDINCFDNEREAIKKYLTTGFFWEV